MQEERKWYTISQAAKYLGVSPDTLRRWEKAGKIESPTRTAGGARRYTKEMLDNILRGDKKDQPKTQPKKKPSPKTKSDRKTIIVGLITTIITLAILLPIFFLLF